MLRNLMLLTTLAVAGTASADGTPRRLEILVTENGFEPATLTVKKGEPVQLSFLRKTDRTCAKKVSIQLGEGKSVERKLPLNERVDVDLTFPAAGKLRYACSMDMITGVITVQ
jgi:plastocyanin domain-containing protein